MHHWHLFARAEVKRPLLYPDRADDFMRRAILAAGMNIIAGPYSVIGLYPGNEGLSSTVLLDFSSANLHEWPDRHPWPLIHFDLYTCGEKPEMSRFLALFEPLGLVAWDAKLIDRDTFLCAAQPHLKAA